MKLSNVLSRCAAAAISIALIACTDSATVNEPDPEAAAKVGETQTLPHALPPPSATTPRYVGVWAHTSMGCEVPAWRFAADGLNTQGEVSCTFNTVQLTDSGYDIQATCHAEGDTTQHQMQISFAESARAMMIAGGPWAEAPSLVYCGPLPQE